MTSILYYYPIYELGQSAEGVGGQRLVGKYFCCLMEIDSFLEFYYLAYDA